MAKFMALTGAAICALALSPATNAQQGGQQSSQTTIPLPAQTPTVRSNVLKPRKLEVSNQVRAAGTTLTQSQRLALARGLAEEEVRGVGAPVHMDLTRGQLGIRSKVEVDFRGHVEFYPNSGLIMLGLPSERQLGRSSPAKLHIRPIVPRSNPPQYYLVEVQYENNADYMRLSYLLNGTRNSTEEIRNLEDSGIFSILIDASSASRQLELYSQRIKIKRISVSPVR